ncbi:glycoside hydrolase [Mucilaginibacter phyllosphaerae]|uniref:Glycoside hydrolase n=2 Tax=Mucilaginibacter phyllosphaerae TaxID=1812349 RepID=A0A4Y8ADD5_9SPHI|nr:glycoside hydrolase [Mucilaginibacter phyllosphaerae]
MLLSRYVRLIFIFAAAVILSSCHSKKKMMRNGSNDPYTMTKPDKDIAEKYAALMGVNRSEIQNGRLYDFIEEWYGTTYRFGGLDKNGVDCSGLTFLLQQQVYGITLPRMTSKQVLVIKRKYEEELKEGDLVFFDFDGKQFSHVGVYLQNGYFVHASTRKGVMIARLHDNGIYKFFSRGGSITDSTSSAQTE